MNAAQQSRRRVLDAIRGALDTEGDDGARKAAVRKRLKTHPSNLVPAQAKSSADANLKLFIEKLEGQSASVSRVSSNSDIPEIVATYLRENNLPAEFRTGTDALFERIPWKKTPALTRHLGRSHGGDAVTISRARTAAAETGTLFLTSGEENPTTLNFLPDTHIMVISRDDILGSYEDAWNALREIYGPRTLPRAVNLVSGPSRTADIEQIIVMGAHGPRRLHVIIVG